MTANKLHYAVAAALLASLALAGCKKDAESVATTPTPVAPAPMPLP